MQVRDDDMKALKAATHGRLKIWEKDKNKKNIKQTKKSKKKHNKNRYKQKNLNR
jgi:hypothetical protein